MEKSLEITPTQARAAYNKADAKGKEMLTELFGKSIVSRKVTDRIHNMQAAFDELGIDMQSSIPFKKPSTQDEIALNAVYKLFIGIRALNEGWQPDFTNKSQYKYWPYFEYVAGSGFGFSASLCDYVGTDSLVGSRLCFPTRELATYAATCFQKEYNEFFTI